MQNKIVKKILKKLIKVLYKDGVYPLAYDYVQSTENTYDDKALAFLDDLVTELLKKL
jgi:hypothetical protein